MNALAEYQQLFSMRYATAPARRTAAAGAVQRHRSSAAISRERLTVSATSEDVVDLVSDVRVKKVAALKQAISAGTYSVSAADLADKLIGSLRRVS